MADEDDFKIEQGYGELLRMIREEATDRLLEGPPEEAHLQPTDAEKEWAEGLAVKIANGVMNQVDAVEPGPPRAAYPKPSFGAAPKGEQEDKTSKLHPAPGDEGECTAQRLARTEAEPGGGPHIKRDGSPPPDRLTPEERTAVLAAVEYFLAAEHDGRHEAESGATHSGYAKLARLSDREPE